MLRSLFLLLSCSIFSSQIIFAQVKSSPQVGTTRNNTGVTANLKDIQKFTIRTESKSFEKTKFRNLSDAKLAVEKYRQSFVSKVAILEKRCLNHFGSGYKYNGISLKQRAIGYMNEDLPVEKFSWKRLIVEAYLQCLKVN